MSSFGIAPVQAMPAVPPYIRFERRAVEKRKTVEEGGESFYVDTDFALVTAMGSKDTTEKIVQEWFPRLKDEVRQGRFPQAWLDAFKGAYDAWKNDQEPPVDGTDIKTWPAISPAQIKMLVGLRVRSIEELAQANEDLINAIGMGGRSLKQKAIDWLTAKQDHGPLVAKIGAMEAAIKGLEARLEAVTQRAVMAEMMLKAKEQVKAPAEVAPPTGDPTSRLNTEKDNTGELVDDALNDALGS